jgi:molybdopterin-guanine dinucleotide biosynthesis protein A
MMPMTPDEIQLIVGVVLAGGRARRMGGKDKSFVLLNDQPLLKRVIVRFRSQVASVIVSGNGPPKRYAEFATPVVADTVDGFAGPLAGMLAGMGWVRANAPDAARIATVAVDTPFFPLDLVSRLSAAAGNDRIAVAMSGGRMHPVFALIPMGLADDLAAFLAAGVSLKVSDWLARHDVVTVEFDEVAGVDPFFNINTPGDLAQAEAVAASCASP